MDANQSIFHTISSLGSILIILMSSYSAWANLVNKKVSTGGFDTLIIFLAKFVIGSKKAQSIYTDPEKIKNMGIMMLLVAIGGTYQILKNGF